MDHLLVGAERMFEYLFKNEQYLRHRLLLKFFVLLKAKVSFAHVKNMLARRFPFSQRIDIFITCTRTSASLRF